MDNSLYCLPYKLATRSLILGKDFTPATLNSDISSVARFESIGLGGRDSIVAVSRTLPYAISYNKCPKEYTASASAP